MEKEILENYIKAGKIAAQVREESRSRAKVGAKLFDLAEWIENRIKELGADIGFPVNISVNNIAAHFTPSKDDETTFKPGDVIKIDIGTHVNGYIGDTATTVSLGGNEDLLKASREALNEAIKIAKPGTKLGEIGTVIEQTIKKYGFKPISNLTGHGLDKYDLHAEPQIPNITNDIEYELKEGQAIAIEPFATTGSGRVNESGDVMIFMLVEPQPVRNFDARRIISFAQKRNGLPFAKRWVLSDLGMSDIRFRLALRELSTKNVLHEYHVLKDVDDCKISQFEHTLIVGDKPIVTTRYEE